MVLSPELDQRTCPLVCSDQTGVALFAYLRWYAIRCFVRSSDGGESLSDGRHGIAGSARKVGADEDVGVNARHGLDQPEVVPHAVEGRLEYRQGVVGHESDDTVGPAGLHEEERPVERVESRPLEGRRVAYVMQPGGSGHLVQIARRDALSEEGRLGGRASTVLIEPGIVSQNVGREGSRSRNDGGIVPGHVV